MDGQEMFLAGVGIAVAVVAGIFVGFLLFSAPGEEPGPAFRAQDIPAMINHETIKWRDRRGKVHMIEVDRKVEVPG